MCRLNKCGEVKEEIYQKLKHMLLIYPVMTVMTPMSQQLGSHVVKAQDSASGAESWSGLGRLKVKDQVRWSKEWICIYLAEIGIVLKHDIL